MAGPYTIPTVTYDGEDPDPVEWANGSVKPAIEDIDLRLVDLEDAPASTLNANQASAPVASGDMLHVPFSGNQAGTSAYASGAMTGAPLTVMGPFSCDAIGARIATAQAGVNAKLLLYDSDAGNNPRNLVATGIIGCGSSGWTLGTFTPVTLQLGLHFAFIRTDTGTTVRFQTVQNPNTLPSYVGIWTGATATWQMPAADVGTYASPNATLTPTSGSSAQYPLMLLRRA